MVDGDTIDCYIDLGFNIKIKNRVRYMGIDTWESRTRDLEEKEKGLILKLRNKELLEQGVFKLKSFGTGKYGRVLGEVYVSPDYVGDHINECIGDSDNSIDLSHDGWVSVNDILIEEGHITIMMVVRKRNFKRMKLKNKKQTEDNKRDI